MNPFRYTTVDERSPYTLKRRARAGGRRYDNEPAITVLPLDPYAVPTRVEYTWPHSPRVYRTVAPKSAKNREASSFVILGDTLRSSPVSSRPGSPTGRVSPFRGHGFKTPTTTRPNSPVTASPKKTPGHTGHVKGIENRERFNRYVGLPPKSPARPSRIPVTKNSTVITVREGHMTMGEEPAPAGEQDANVGATETTTTTTAEDTCDNADMEVSATEPEKSDETPEEEKCDGAAEAVRACDMAFKGENADKSFETIENIKENTKSLERLMPADYYRGDRTADVRKSPSSRGKTKTEKNQSNVQQRETYGRKSGKPPIAPRKIGMKTSLKGKEDDDMRNKGTRGMGKDKGGRDKATGPGKKQQTADGSGRGMGEMDGPGPTSLGPSGDDPKTSDTTGQEGKAEKLVPCYQPDKCNLAPPTMASPSPIITPSISTPSTSADVAGPGSMLKSSQSISTAPTTTVTSCSLSSVSSTVVLSENLARKEIGKSRDSKLATDDPAAAAAAAAVARTPDSIAEGNLNGGSGAAAAQTKVPVDMVKAGSRNHIKVTEKADEIASATKVIKGEPEMEVLSPNNLRMPPPPQQPPQPNMAWDEERIPNGDVPARAPRQGKFRRFVSALWKVLGYLFCCPCLRALLCCCGRAPGDVQGASGRGRCCTCCGNPFKCLTCQCKKAKCCEGRRCCGRGQKTKSQRTKSGGKCCAKPVCSCRGCCDRARAACLVFREKVNGLCRCLFCLNLTCCQNLLKKCKCCHKLKCCQSNGCCSCCNPYAKSEPKKLIKKGSRASNNSKGNDQLDVVLVEHNSKMKAAIPVLPSCLAILCLIFNIFIPGSGTITSGFLCLCFGKPRFSTNDTPKNRIKSLVINIIIGVAQIFTVVFCLVGWGWSIWWGVIMYKLSRRQKRLKLAEKNQKEAGSSNVNHNHVDVEQG